MLKFNYLRIAMSAIPHLKLSALRCSILVAALALALSTFSVVAAAQDAPDDPVTIFNQAQDLHEKGRLTEAIALYDKAINIAPEFPEALYQRGLAELAIGNKTAAENSLRRAVDLRADWSLALSSLGSLLVNQRKYAEAERILTRAIELDAQNFPALTAMTELRLKTKAPRTVLKELLAKMMEITSKANPPNSVWAARAALQNSLGEAKEARFSINRVLSVDPTNRLALTQSAEIAISGGDIRRAEADVRQLEKTNPDDELVKLLRARILLSDGNTNEALEILKSDKLAGSQEAADLRKLVEEDAATSAADLEKQLESEPKNARLLGRLCTLYRRGDPTKALDYCRRAAEAEPDNINHAAGFGAALVQAKQFESAVTLLKKLVAVAPDNSTIRANLGAALFQLKRYAEAKTEFEWLTNSQPRSAGAYLFLAISHDRLGEYVDAMANYQQYLRLADPAENNPDVDKVTLRLPELQKLLKKK